MLEERKKKNHFSALARLAVTAVAMTVPFVETATAQDPAFAVPSAPFGAGLSLSPKANARAGWLPPASVSYFDGTSARATGVRRITLEQVKQQALAAPANNPLARLGQLSIEAAKQHRLGVQADYFPKLGATFMNLHYTKFLGEVLTVRRPFLGSLAQVPLPLFSQDQTIAAATFVQPITPLFEVHQAVKIARADERIAMAKAGVSIAKNLRDGQVEEIYFRLLIAQRQLTSAELRVKSTEKRPLLTATSIESLGTPPEQGPEFMEAKKALLTTETEVRELTVSLNRMLDWPDDTELDLVLPDPLVENISLTEVADKTPGANPGVIEAEQTVIKARAANVLSKLAYVPTVAAVGGYLFQNAIPLVPNNFGYGGVMATYTLFDFGKRQRAVREARAQLEMAEIGLQLTKVKIADDLKKSYFELERARQLSQLAQKMAASMGRLLNVSSASESMETKAARAKVEEEMLEADLAHRQAFARLNALMGPRR